MGLAELFGIRDESLVLCDEYRLGCHCMTVLGDAVLCLALNNEKRVCLRGDCCSGIQPEDLTVPNHQCFVCFQSYGQVPAGVELCSLLLLALQFENLKTRAPHFLIVTNHQELLPAETGNFLLITAA